MFNLCVLKAGFIPPSLKGNFSSYPKMFEDFLKIKKKKWIVDTFSIYNGDFPKDIVKYDGFLITGSKFGVYEDHFWMKDLFRIIIKIVETNIPLIGICFGHQAIAQALGGLVEKSNKGWGVGIIPMDNYIIKPWMGNLSKSIKLICFHQDQVISLPPNSDHIGGNKFCNYSSFSLNNSVYTLQGHPEFNNEYAMQLLNLRRDVIGEEKFLNAKNNLVNNKHDGKEISNSLANFLEQKF